MAEEIRYYGKATCSKCQRALALLRESGVPFRERDYATDPLNAEEIGEIAGGRSVLELINPQRDAYRELGFDTNPPTEAEALLAMVENNNLVIRPIVVRGDRMVRGFDEAALRDLITGEAPDA